MATTTRDTASSRDALQTAAALFGATFLLVGILGFIPGIVTNYDSMTFAGHGDHTEHPKLLGLFEVSILHNIVHALFGVAGLAMARTAGAAKTFLVGGGIVYLALWLYGMLVDYEADANFVPFNDADNWLHLGLGSAMVILGLALAGRTMGMGPRGGHTARAH